VNVRQAYEAELAAKGFKSDPAQLRAVDALQRCADEWTVYKGRRSNALKKLINHPDLPKGVYMYGGVGRGKSFLMECFFNAVPLKRKVRLHFHEFMREVHREMHLMQGTQNPLDALGAKIAKKYKLICFDEFHVADITDAMILYKLLESLFANGVGFVTTSNFEPDGLYPGGLHRDRILPAIALLKERMEVVNVDNGTDYRRRTLEDAKLYHCPLGPEADAAMQETFDRLAEALKASAPHGSAGVIRHVAQEVRHFTGNNLRQDDFTLIAIFKK
jgi:cell division protein ZapE